MKTLKLSGCILTVVLAIWSIVSCEKEDPPKSAEKQITAFSINQTGGIVNENAKTIDVMLPFVADITALSPEITISLMATITPASGVAQDFSSPVIYTDVVVKNGATILFSIPFTIIEN